MPCARAMCATTPEGCAPPRAWLLSQLPNVSIWLLSLAGRTVQPFGKYIEEESPKFAMDARYGKGLACVCRTLAHM